MQLVLKYVPIEDGIILKLVVTYRRWFLGLCFLEEYTAYGRTMDDAMENVTSKVIERSGILQAVKVGTMVL